MATNKDDLFGKLDSLISKHQGQPGGRPHQLGVPVLTEAVTEASPRRASDVPVLSEVVDVAADPAASAEAAAVAERRRLLQVALYLRLRQRIDDELQRGFALPEGQPAMEQFAAALRAALPDIVRESVEQVFGPDGGPRQ
jgi:hypothetical protein